MSHTCTPAKEKLELLKPSAVEAYIRDTGRWLYDNDWKCAKIFLFDEDPEIEVLIPNMSTYPDYARRISEVLNVLSIVEERCPNVIYDEILRNQ